MYLKQKSRKTYLTQQSTNPRKSGPNSEASLVNITLDRYKEHHLAFIFKFLLVQYM
jgi:hypothetical protein